MSTSTVKMKRKSKVSSGLVEKKWSVDRTIMFIVLVLYCATWVFVLGWAFLASLKGRIEYIRSSLALPKKWLFSNYVTAWQKLQADGNNMFTMLGNSIWLSILPPTISLFTAAMASYVMAQYKFPGRDLIWAIMIFMMVMPVLGNSAAVYKLYIGIGMYNSPLYLLRFLTGLGGNMLLIASFKGLSKSYMEAAFMEGAGHMRIFFSIMLPLVINTLAALWIMDFIGYWNDYMGPLMYVPKYVPITTGIYIYQKKSERFLDVPILFAASLMVLIPPVVLFSVFQDKFTSLSYGGGIKS